MTDVGQGWIRTLQRLNNTIKSHWSTFDLCVGLNLF